MIGVNVRFDYDGDFDRERVVGVADGARAMFEGMPGLRFKFFTFDARQRQASNFYVWESREAWDAFFNDRLMPVVRPLMEDGGRAPETRVYQLHDYMG